MYFAAADFDLYQPHFQGDPEWNGRRLDVRQRLQAIGDALCAQFKDQGVGLDRRESLHHPHATNGKKVRRQRSMMFRDKKSRKALQGFLGKELGKDLDSAVNNLHFQVGLDDKEAYWGLRIDSGAWYDLNVLLKRVEENPGREEIVAACRQAPGFQLEIDRGGPRPLDGMTNRDWRDLAGTLRPGENSLEVVRRMPKHEVAEGGEDFGPLVCADLFRLAEFYGLACWSLDSPSGASL